MLFLILTCVIFVKFPFVRHYSVCDILGFFIIITRFLTEITGWRNCLSVEENWLLIETVAALPVLWGIRNQDISVNRAKSYRLIGQNSIPGRVKGFFSTASRSSLRTTHHPVQWGSATPSLGGKADHSPPSSAELKNGGAVPPLPHTSSWCDA
jgi:hypothetical protein